MDYISHPLYRSSLTEDKMRPLKEYLDELKTIAREASRDTKIRGSHVAWGMMIVGVLVTGTQTYALCYLGMIDNVLWQGWVIVAAFLPTLLLEGSALSLVYGRHHWFRSIKQRALADIASWVIWIVLALTTIAHFSLGKSTDGYIQGALHFYASYILPLSIVLVPMLWKRLYDSAPESEARIEVMEAESELRSSIIDIQREQNRLMIDSYRDSLNTPRVEAARNALFEQASIEHAKDIINFIEGTEEIIPELVEPEEIEPETTAIIRMPRWRGNVLLNPEDFSADQREQLMSLRRTNGVDHSQ
jgi:hypothetical protein